MFEFIYIFFPTNVCTAFNYLVTFNNKAETVVLVKIHKNAFLLYSIILQ